MKNAIIVHGRVKQSIYYSDRFPASSNFAWIPWLQKQLLIRDIKADTPEMPKPFDPVYAEWKRELERFDLTEETCLIGHSMGGGFLLKYVSEQKDLYIDTLCLVAPSIDPLQKYETDFYRFTFDPELTKRVGRFVLVSSDNDSEGVMETVKVIQEEISEVALHVMPGYGHFIEKDMGGVEFSALVSILCEKKERL